MMIWLGEAWSIKLRGLFKIPPAKLRTPPACAGSVKPFLGVFQFIFGCRHRHMSRVFTIKHRTYRVCFDCGREFDLPDVHTPGRSSVADNAHPRTNPLCVRTLRAFEPIEDVPVTSIATSELSCSDAPLDVCHYRYS